MKVQAASWSGAVEVEVFQGKDDADCFCVSLIPWKGVGQSCRIVSGEFGGVVEHLQPAPALWTQELRASQLLVKSLELNSSSLEAENKRLREQLQVLLDDSVNGFAHPSHMSSARAAIASQPAWSIWGFGRKVLIDPAAAFVGLFGPTL
jgi:hypothetical protein